MTLPTVLRVLRIALLAALVVLVAQRAVSLTRTFEFAVDFEIPLRAAERWLDGQHPYDPQAFSASEGPDLPFLYPPFVLPLLAPLVDLPRRAVHVAWVGLCLLSALAACRRLGLRPVWWPLAVLWPPFLEGIWNGNVQVHLFTAFVFALAEPPGSRAQGPRMRTFGREAAPRWRHGLLASLVGAVKVSQVHAWLLVLRVRPRSAWLGVLPLVGLLAATWPVVGPETYRDWLDQAERAVDPAWPPIGAPLTLMLPRPIALAVSVASLALVFLIPRARVAVWTGLLMVVAAPTVHTYAWLFLLPALLLLRRELTLLGALYFASYDALGWWIGCALTAAALLAAERLPALRHACTWDSGCGNGERATMGPAP